jgi:hypothetical protein
MVSRCKHERPSKRQGFHYYDWDPNPNELFGENAAAAQATAGPDRRVTAWKVGVALAKQSTGQWVEAWIDETMEASWIDGSLYEAMKNRLADFGKEPTTRKVGVVDLNGEEVEVDEVDVLVSVPGSTMKVGCWVAPLKQCKLILGREFIRAMSEEGYEMVSNK